MEYKQRRRSWRKNIEAGSPLRSDQINEIQTIKNSDNICNDTFTAHLNRKAYEVTWLGDNDSTLEVDEQVGYGDLPTYDGDTPVKASDQECNYSFSGWSPTVVEVTGDATYKAQFTCEAIVPDPTPEPEPEPEPGPEPTPTPEPEPEPDPELTPTPTPESNPAPKPTPEENKDLKPENQYKKETKDKTADVPETGALKKENDSVVATIIFAGIEALVISIIVILKIKKSHKKLDYEL